jgi:hypothetical protein
VNVNKIVDYRHLPARVIEMFASSVMESWALLVEILR